MELQSFHNFKKNSFSNCPRSWSNDQLPGLSLCPKGSQKHISKIFSNFFSFFWKRSQKSVTTGIIEGQTKDLSIEPWKQNMQSSGSYPLYVERQVFCRHDSFWTSDLQRYETGLLVRSDRNEAYAGQWYFRLVAAMRAPGEFHGEVKRPMSIWPRCGSEGSCSVQGVGDKSNTEKI